MSWFLNLKDRNVVVDNKTSQWLKRMFPTSESSGRMFRLPEPILLPNNQKTDHIILVSCLGQYGKLVEGAMLRHVDMYFSVLGGDHSLANMHFELMLFQEQHIIHVSRNDDQGDIIVSTNAFPPKAGDETHDGLFELYQQQIEGILAGLVGLRALPIPPTHPLAEDIGVGFGR